MAARGGKPTQQDTGRAPARTRSTSGKKAETDKGDAAVAKAVAPKKSNGATKRAAPRAAKVVKAAPAVATRAKPRAARAEPVEATRPVAEPSALTRPIAEPRALAAPPAYPSPEDRRRMIELAAYLRAERAGFGNTNPLQDWIEAEREVEASLAARQS